MEKPKCSFCSGILQVTIPVDNMPAFRCNKCNVRVCITNPSYMPYKLRQLYDKLVSEQLVQKQDQYFVN